ncbi:MAG: FAD-dependent oxidoreductase [bacterium]|nr:FAD-dependent oxidoreductase [bacterium]
MYDLTIIGGGPAGVSGGVYAARKRLKTLFITESFGGQSIVSEDIQNWIGFPSISGTELAKSMEAHLRTYASDIVDIKIGSRVKSIEKKDANFAITLESGEVYESKMILLTVGSTRRKLTVPGADIFENKGITYCASCDGPIFSGKDVAVIGGGNAGFETTAQLSAYCKSVTLIHRSESFSKADPLTIEKVLGKPNVKGVLNAELLSIEGDKFVTGLTYKNSVSGEIIKLPVEGVFVEIGLVPSTDFVKELVELNSYGQIIIDPKTEATKTPGIWAAGDCTDSLYHQNNIASGDAVRALEDIYVHLHTK